MVLLLERGHQDRRALGNWLCDNGFVAWTANDVGHAIEELSDFTVKNRPDVVLLEVLQVPRDLDDLNAAFGLAQDTHVQVCAYSPATRGTGGRFCASSLDQLKAMIGSEVRPSARAHA